jgi:hypothetical protein
MKEVVSVSLGSSQRDHVAESEFLGEKFRIRRVGADGDFDKAIALLRELDGRVDAIGLGGIDLYFCANGKRYLVRDATRLRNAVQKTPVVDGSGLKNTLEREVIRHLVDKEGWELKGKTVLMVSAVDRFGMAEALHEAGCKIIFGDLMFGLKIPVPLRSMTTFRFVAALLLPIVTKLPFEFLYPTGEKQDKSPKNRYQKYYDEAEVIAGDYLFIKRYLPSDLREKIIITNTVTQRDVDELRARGAAFLVTTTPELQGRSFGTNVMEAVLVAIIGKPWLEIAPAEYLDLLKKLDFKPRIERLN